MVPYYKLDEGPQGLHMMFVHPLGADQWFWNEVCTHLSGTISTIALDLPGSGQTTLPKDGLTVDSFLGAIEAVRFELGAKKLVLVGCAVGAMVAARYAAQNPEHTVGLVMANPGIRITPAASKNLSERADLVLQDGLSTLVPAVIDNAFNGQTDDASKADYQARFLAQDSEGYARSAQAVCNFDIASDLPDISCPSLMVRGELDLLFPEVHSAEIRTIKPDTELQTLTNGAHFIPYQLPETFAQILKGFLATLAT